MQIWYSLHSDIHPSELPAAPRRAGIIHPAPRSFTCSEILIEQKVSFMRSGRQTFQLLTPDPHAQRARREGFKDGVNCQEPPQWI